jgi:predicted transcriptional regulator
VRCPNIEMNIEKLIHIDRLIRIKAGNAKDIGTKVSITERAVYKYIKYMRTELKAPIAFDSYRKSYHYSEEGRLNFTWQTL